VESTIRMHATLIGDLTQVQALVRHPMASGFGKDASDAPIPAHYIETLTFEYKGKIVFVADWGPMISKDPYVKFSFAGGEKGRQIKASWTDNKGMTDSTTEEIQ